MEMKRGCSMQELVKKSYYFFKEKINVHICLKSRYYYNGRIKEVMENEYILLFDKIYGEVVLYFDEIADVEELDEGRENVRYSVMEEMQDM